MLQAQTIVDLATNKMAEDVLLLDLTGLTIIADYFVIATGDSERQLRAIAEDLTVEMKRTHNSPALSVEGTPESGWLLIDFGSVVVHLFSREQRERYRLEDFWSEAKVIVRIA